MSSCSNESINSRKLEKRLLEIDKESPISNDTELIRAIDAIIDLECELPDDERNYGLIDEAVKTVAILRGIDLKDLEDKANLAADKIIQQIKEIKE